MRKRAFPCVILLLLFMSSRSFAHETSYPLLGGQADFSLYWSPFLGADYFSLWTFRDDNYAEPTGVAFLPITSSYNMAYAGTIALFEYGILDFLSIGIRLNFVDSVVFLIRDNHWWVYGSAFVRACFLKTDFLTFQGSTECQVSPVFSDPKSNWFGDGLINLFSNLSFSFPVWHTKDIGLYAYMDLKHITSFINTAYMAPQFTLEGNINLPAEKLAAIDVTYGNMNRIAVAPGLDFRWGGFMCSVGMNFPLFDFSTNPKTYYLYLKDLFNNESFFQLENIEFNWRWRL